MPENKETEESEFPADEGSGDEPVSAAFVVIDRKGNIVTSSSSAKQLLHLDAMSTLTGLNLFNLFEHLPSIIRNYQQSDVYFEFEADLRKSSQDTEQVSISIGIFPAEQSGDQEPVNIAFMRDTSMQRHAEVQLAQASRHYWALFEASSDAIFLELADGTIFNCNKSCERLYGYSKAELLCMNARDLVPGNVLATIESLIPELESVRNSRKGIQLEAVGRRKDGSLFSNEILVNFVKVNGEECFAVAIRDISGRREIESSRKRYEGQVLQLQKLITFAQMANGLANDFNNLLTGIMGYSDLILRELPEESTSREKARRIVDAARKASEIIQQLMAYSGKLPTLFQKTSLKNMLRELQPVFKQIAGEWVEIHQAVDEGLPEIQLNPPMLKQALKSIVKNAVEALDKNRRGEVGVTAFLGLCSYSGSEPGYFGPPVKSGSYLAIKVSDNGTGIEPENLNRIFDPFYSTRFSGRGLGLSSVIGMLRSHRGAVMVTSNFGQGTDFVVFLPLDSDANLGEGACAAHVDEPFPAGCVLVIDDDENVREILANNIKMLGYEVFVAGNGKEGIEIFKSQQRKLNVVLTDLLMPGMNGIEVIKQIRWMNPEIPVIVCTGLGSGENASELEKLGVSAVLEKPFSHKDIEKHFSRIQIKSRNRNNGN